VGEEGGGEVKTFVTDDGYTFYFVDGEWVDHEDPEKVDMTFHADAEGHPVDETGERLEGEYK
jgi:hypothetical protein